MSEGLTSWTTAIFQRGKTEQVRDESDYIGSDGLLYCGKCHTPKQCRVDTTAENGKKIKFSAPVWCDCKRAEQEKAKQELKRAHDMAAIENLRNQSLMGEQFKKHTFNSFRVNEANKAIYEASKDYVEHFDELAKKGQGLLIWGDVGVGKTFAASCIANELLNRQVPVVMTSFVKLLESTRSFGTDEEQMMRNLNRAKLLILDDLGVERDTDYALEKVYNIINSRIQTELPMIITTNLSVYDMMNATDIRYKRIYDRIFQKCEPVIVKGKSFRKEEAVQRHSEMKVLFDGR